MSTQSWSDACKAARSIPSQRAQSTLYGTHAFTVACFVCGSAFTGLWLNRWRRLKRANPEHLPQMWRLLGHFLSLAFTSCVFGTAAWIAKITFIYNNLGLAAIQSNPDDDSTCQHALGFAVRGNQSQSAYRIAYAVEVLCLFLCTLLVLDRISEHAHRSKLMASKKMQRSDHMQALSSPSAAARPIPIQRTSEGHRPSLSHSNPRSSLLDLSPVSKGANRALQLIFKAGIAFVALCFLAVLAAVISAAAFGAKLSHDYQRAADACDPDGNYTQAAVTILSATDAANSAPQIQSIFAGYVTEFAAALVVIAMYVAVGCLCATVVRSARTKIDASRAKLVQHQTTVGSHDESKAAVAGAARSCCCRVRLDPAATVTLCFSFEHAARCNDHRQFQNAAPGGLLLHRPAGAAAPSSIHRLFGVRKRRLHTLSRLRPVRHLPNHQLHNILLDSIPPRNSRHNISLQLCPAHRCVPVFHSDAAGEAVAAHGARCGGGVGLRCKR